MAQMHFRDRLVVHVLEELIDLPRDRFRFHVLDFLLLVVGESRIVVVVEHELLDVARADEALQVFDGHVLLDHHDVLEIGAQHLRPIAPRLVIVCS